MKAITQKEIGKRIAELRKSKGYSQDDLAKMLKLSRPSITQMELGNRNISVIELKQISDILTVSMDKLLSSEYSLNTVVTEEHKELKQENIRVSVPKLNVNKLKNILLYVLVKCGAKPNLGETVLYKLLYFADFNYYELFEEHLTGAEYRKLPYGPVPQELDSIINQMIEQKLLKRFKTDYHGYPQTRYIPLSNPDLSNLNAKEKEVIDKVIHQYSDWSASAISSYSHKDMPWRASKDGEVIDYELVFYRESPFSVRNYDEDVR